MTRSDAIGHDQTLITRADRHASSSELATIQSILVNYR